MSELDLFYSAKPTFPWSVYPVGLPALALVAAVLVFVTLWTYLGHPQVSGRRLTLVLGLRLAALVVALLTALRPSVGVQEDPKVPSTLLIGVDLSESMTVRDEVNTQPRIAAVRKVLEKCEPLLEELRSEQNVNVQLYAFGDPGFAESTGKYDPAAPAAFKRSDYGAYLRRTFDRWSPEQYVRAHLVIGDGADNGQQFPAEAEAQRWRQQGKPVHTFAVGRTDIPEGMKDVAIATVSADPSPVPVKNDLVIRVVVNAYGFEGIRVPVVVEFDTGKGYEKVATETATLAKTKGNIFEVKVKAPDQPGEVKVRVEIPVKDVPGDVSEANNKVETYLTVTKEGIRVLIVNRLGFEHALIRRALLGDKRIDLYQAIRQTDDPPTPGEREDFDFDQRQYDVVVIGNVSAAQLTSVDPTLPAKLAERVRTKGMGLLFTGGHAAFGGTPGRPNAGGWLGVKELDGILPVRLDGDPKVPADFFTGNANRFQYLPVAREAGHYLNKVKDTEPESNKLWDTLNQLGEKSRFTGLSRLGSPIPTATVFAVASPQRTDIPVPVNPLGGKEPLAPVLVGHQIGEGNRGRVLALAAQDTYLWQKLGQPKANDGRELHARFWRQLVRWLAHQDEDEGAAFARPEFRRLPVATKQRIKVGLRAPGGADAVDPKFQVKVIAPGETEAASPPRNVIPDPNGGFVVPYDPRISGEYTVKVSGVGSFKEGDAMKEVKGDATARFIAYPETSDEMLRTAADHDYLQKLAADGGGKFHRLDELPAFLKELKGQPMEVLKPKPKFYPDWRRNNSKGFLPGWLVVFVALLGTEWALRRVWGLV